MKKTVTIEQWHDLLDHLKEEHGWTQDQLSAILGVQTKQVKNILGRKISKEDTMIGYFRSIAEYLGTNLDALAKRARLLRFYGLESGHQCIEIGDTPTLFAMASGDGRRRLLNSDVTIEEVDPTRVILPASLEAEHAKIRTEHSAGKHDFVDNPLLTLVHAKWFPPLGADERPFAKLEVTAAPYSLLYTIRNTEIGRETFSELVDCWRLKDGPISPVLGGGLGVSAAIVTSDNQMLFGRRDAVKVRASQIDVGAVEGLRLEDGQVSPENAKPYDVEAVIRRAVDEEYGLTSDLIDEVAILGLGFDLGWAQWNVIGFVRTSGDAASVLNRQKTSAIHRSEYGNLEVIPSDPKSVFSYLANERQGIWSCGLATAFYTLVHTTSIRDVERAAAGKKFRITHNLL